jgi:hypothetical protein
LHRHDYYYYYYYYYYYCAAAIADVLREPQFLVRFGP